MTDFFAKILKLLVIVPKGASNTDLFKHKVFRRDRIVPLTKQGLLVSLKPLSGLLVPPACLSIL